jgi:hypothetical protein
MMFFAPPTNSSPRRPAYDPNVLGVLAPVVPRKPCAPSIERLLLDGWDWINLGGKPGAPGLDFQAWDISSPIGPVHKEFVR